MPEESTADSGFLLKRLNPFALPTETEIRFRLLVAAAITATCVISAVCFEILSVFLGYGSGYDNNPGYEAILRDLMDEKIESVEKAIPLFRHDFYDSLLQILWIGGFVAILLGLAYLLYRTYPTLIRKRWKLTPLERDQDQKFYDATRHMMTQAISSASPVTSEVEPVVYVDASPLINSVPESKVFGKTKQPALGLTSGVRLEFRKNVEKFRARILHEVAHIVNGDLYRDQFSHSIWMSFVLVALPLLVILIALVGLLPDIPLGPRLFQIFFFCVQIGSTWAVMMAIRSGMLRRREFYADWRVAQWDKNLGQALLEYFRDQSASEKTSRFKLPWQFHPSSRERARSLEDSRETFKLRPGLAVLTGILCGYMFSWVLVFLPLIGMTFSSGFFLMLLPAMLDGVNFSSGEVSIAALLIGVTGVTITIIAKLVLPFVVCFLPLYLVAWILGAQVQRQAVVDELNQNPKSGGFLRWLGPALGVTIGYELGLYLMPASAGSFFPQNFKALLAGLIVNSMLLASMWIWLLYMRFYSAKIIGNHISASPPVKKRRWLTRLSAVTLSILTVPVFFSRLLILKFNGEGNTQGFSPELFDALSIIWVGIILGASLCCLCAFVMMWGLTGVFERRSNHERHRACARCQSTNPHGRGPAALCFNCQQPLAAWLFTEPLEIFKRSQDEGDTLRGAR